MVFSLKYHHVLFLSLVKVASYMQSNAGKKEKLVIIYLA